MPVKETISNQLSEYSYVVPKELIAQKPPVKRGDSKLLVMDRKSGKTRDLFFKDIINFLEPDDCLVINRTKVIPARVFAKKETGGKVEILFIEPKAQAEPGKYLVMMKPGVLPGKKIYFENNVNAEVLGCMPDNLTLIALEKNSFDKIIEAYGVMPLPPYIKRGEKDPLADMDKERYQTVFAKESGSIAAPTAGLHFSDSMLEQIREKGVKVVEIILHVGRGTFKPIESEDITKHLMLPEYYEISGSAAETINSAIESGKKVVGCGTTTVRAIESSAEEIGGSFRVVPKNGFTSAFFYPGYNFKIINSMLTNLHLPKSTPLMMVCAFAGKGSVLEAYKEAVEKKYSFFSYGDAMLIV